MCKVAVIIPSYNERNIHDFVEEVEMVVGPDQIVVCNDRYGKGKGYALREALRYAEADYYIFIDGDKDIHPKQIQLILYYLRDGYDVVVGKKQLPVRRGRRILTYLSRIWIKLLFNLTVDSQTGIKGFNYRPEWKTDGWACDIEILWKAKRQDKTMIEVPIHATVSSGKSVCDILSTLKDTIKIRWGL